MRRAFVSGALLLSACSIARIYYGEPLPPGAEIASVRTADGAEIQLVHYAPTSAPRAAPPVVLCHGIGGNARHMDLDAEHSMARWFASRGYDAWAISLRGSGERLVAGAGALSDPDAVSLDTYAERDLPAAFDFVRARTGAAQVDYVGHSMGGLVLYIYLARGGEAVRAAATMGSPVRLRWGGELEAFIRGWGGPLAKHIAYVPTDMPASFYVPFAGEVQTPIELLVYNPENVTQASFKRLAAEGMADIAGGVLRQFERNLADDRFGSADGKLDYLAMLGKVKTPVLVVAGKQDRIALVDGVKAGYAALGGEKAFWIAGEENGCAADYGHADLIIGERAPEEVWPRVQTWFDGH